MDKTIYYNQVRKEIQRLISLQDRELFSQTYGCFDRTYWGWKFTDFPGARFQEGVYTLAYLYSHSFPGNNFAMNQRAFEWAVAGMKYWKSIQYPDGSFDEAYPFEHSLAATSFTSFYLGEAFLLLKNNLAEEEKNGFVGVFKQAGNWLINNDEHHGILSNHLAVAAAALYVIYLICDEGKYKERCFYFLQRIYDHQSKEGWYEEYGGADPGYQTHGTFYLAWIWKKTDDSILLESLKRSLAFLKYFIHPNGTLGGEYGSRNTEFYFPAGFEILSPVLSDAALIAKFMRKSVKNQDAAGLAAMDAYNFFPLLNNYLFAAEYAGKKDIDTQLPCKEECETFFPDAGLYVKSTPTYYCVLGLSKGGVLKVYDKNTEKLVTSDCSYWAELYNGNIISSQTLQRLGDWKIGDKNVKIKVNFDIVNQRVQTPFLFIGFRLFTLTFGRNQKAAYWIKKLLVKVLVNKHRFYPLQLTREICFAKDQIHINDQISLKGKLKLLKFRQGAKFSTIHMGSSRYFQNQELSVSAESKKDWADELMRNKNIKIEFCYKITK